MNILCTFHIFMYGYVKQMSLETIYLVYMCKKDVAFNDQQWLICQSKVKYTTLSITFIVKFSSAFFFWHLLVCLSYLLSCFFLRFIFLFYSLVECSPDAPGGSKIALGPVGIPLKRGTSEAINLASPRRVKACGDVPLRVKACGDVPCGDVASTDCHWTHPTNDKTRLTKVRPIPAPPSSTYAPLCLEVFGICLQSYQPDEYGTRPFLGGSGRRAEARTHQTFLKMPRASSAFP